MEKEDLRELIDSGMLQKNPDIQLVKDELNKLAAHGFVKELSDQYFEFENNLTWEVVYETLLYAERRRLHDLVACHIEKRHEGQLKGVADVLAYHYKKSGNIRKTIWYLAIAGEHAASMYANEDAIANFNRALDLLDESGEMLASDKGLLLEKIADIYRRTGKYKKATEHYQQVLGFEKNNKSKRNSKHLPWKVRFSTRISNLCRKIAVTHERQSKYKDSLEWLDEAQKNLPGRPGRISSQIAATKSVALYRMGKYTEAIDWGKKALRHAKRLNINVDIAYAHNMLGSVYMVIGAFDKATMHWGAAVEKYQSLEDYSGIASANCNMGCVSMLVGDLEDSVKRYSIALEADERVQNASSVAMDHTNIGEVLVSKGAMEEASSHLKHVLEAYDAGLCPPDLTGMALINLSRCELAGGNLSAAEDFVEKGISLIRETGQKWLLAEADLQKSELLVVQNKLDESVSLCKETLSEILKLDAKPLQARGERILAWALLKQNNLEQAKEHVDTSISIAKSIGAKQEEARSIVTMVDVLQKLGEPLSLASTYLKKAITIFTEIGAEKDLNEAKKILNAGLS